MKDRITDRQAAFDLPLRYLDCTNLNLSIYNPGWNHFASMIPFYSLWKEHIFIVLFLWQTMQSWSSKSVLEEIEEGFNWWSMETPPPGYGVLYSVLKEHFLFWSFCGRRCNRGSCSGGLQRVFSSLSCSPSRGHKSDRCIWWVLLHCSL